MNLVRFRENSRRLLAIPILLRFRAPSGIPALPRGPEAWRRALQVTYYLLAAAVRHLSRKPGGRAYPWHGPRVACREEELRKLRTRLTLLLDALEQTARASR